MWPVYLTLFLIYWLFWTIYSYFSLKQYLINEHNKWTRKDRIFCVCFSFTVGWIVAPEVFLEENEWLNKNLLKK